MSDSKGVPSKASSEVSRRPIPRSNFSLFVVGAAAFLVAFVLNSSLRSTSNSLPVTYALCSREGNIYTVDRLKDRIECVVVHHSFIADVGTVAEIRTRWGDKQWNGPASAGSIAKLLGIKSGLKFIYTKPGHIVVPGLTDAHAHVLEYGFKRNLELDGCRTIEELIGRVKDYVISRPDVLNDPSVWIQGMGWDQTKWPDKRFPDADIFENDNILKGRPIALRRVDSHAIFVSEKVLQLTGSLPKTVDGGSIVRRPNGKPTGVFVDNAMSLIKLPPWTEKQYLEYFSTTMREALSHGLTSIHDAASEPGMISFFKRMAEKKLLPLRLYLMGYVDVDQYWGDRLEKIVNHGPAGRLTLRGVKLFADGALGSWGAALLEPYSDRRESKGFLLTSPRVLSEWIKRFIVDGFQVAVHCIGDQANKVILDIFEDVLAGRNATELRPRIEHAQILTPEDVVRAGRLGVISSVQPTHATSDMWYAEQRLGSKRITHSYVYKSQLNASNQGVLPLGSDFPVEGINPLLGFYAAISRLSVTGDSPHGAGGWFPDQRLSRAEALKGMTYDPAYASYNENRLGSLSPGKLADFVVLDRNIMTVPVSEILQTKVVATVIDGRPMYGQL